jgi:hypothetical protein
MQSEQNKSKELGTSRTPRLSAELYLDLQFRFSRKRGANFNQSSPGKDAPCWCPTWFGRELVAAI